MSTRPNVMTELSDIASTFDADMLSGRLPPIRQDMPPDYVHPLERRSASMPNQGPFTRTHLDLFDYTHWGDTQWSAKEGTCNPASPNYNQAHAEYWMQNR